MSEQNLIQALSEALAEYLAEHLDSNLYAKVQILHKTWRPPLAWFVKNKQIAVILHDDNSPFVVIHWINGQELDNWLESETDKQNYQRIYATCFKDIHDPLYFQKVADQITYAIGQQLCNT